MFRLLAFILLIISFSSLSGTINLTNAITKSGFVLLPAGPCGPDLASCKSAALQSFYASCSASSNPCPFTLGGGYLDQGKLGLYYSTWGPLTVHIKSAYSQVDDGNECSTNAECFFLANQICENGGQLLSDFLFVDAGNYSFSCSDLPPDPADSCEENVIQQCSSHLGMSSYLYEDDGLGGNSCSGTCNDGTNAEDQCIETLANHYCDVVEPPSELDFGAGGTGSSVDPSNTTAEDSVSDIDYEPDGTAADPTAPFSSIQGDKLINEVIKNRNDNTTNLAATTDTTNQTIVEKSDDISETVSNSANGIIDAVNDIVPFYDGNIVQGMEQFSVKIDNLADIFGNLKEDVVELKDDLATDLGSGYISSGVAADFTAYDSIFSTDSNDTLEASIVTIKDSIKAENDSFQTTLTNIFSLSFTSSPNFENRSLDLGDWGSHDISLNRFIALFNGIGNIIYFLAAMTALTIVLGGIKL